MSEQSKLTVWYGWDGDNLVLTEKDNQRIHTVYYPNSFVPLLRIEGSIPSLTQPLGDAVEQALTVPLTTEVKRQLNLLEPNLINNSLTAEDLNWIQQSQLTPQQLSQFIKPTSSADLSECTIQYYNCNHLGTPQMLVDLHGNAVWQADYDPWGNQINEKKPSNLYQPIRMQGQHYDEESGLHYNRYRYYDPKSGRYITQDPIGLLGGMNGYNYPLNPLQYIDYFGLDGILEIHSSGTGLTDGHSWIKYTPTGGMPTTYGTWGNRATGPGLYENLEVGDTGDASRSLYIDDEHEKKLMNRIQEYRNKGKDGWRLNAPCSSFARDSWEVATGENLNSNILWGLGPISNPENLKLSIIKANGGVNHNNGVKANTPSSASLGSLGRSSGEFSSSSSSSSSSSN